ncbi:hypothetical protein CLIB1423_02S10022 [[Candida] railenensis]|uniref:Uncharacterized protein n=1 Tax=[Candida] railenensis TaxID=45579 RepID=A0A9P0VX12_9ASCO|nr:hypothetical protein CLIB1423_02S10022 [[Candida] railenensis]
MGSSASKPSRKLASSIQKGAGDALLANRKTNVNTLPSESLKEKYIQHNDPNNVESHLPLSNSSSFRGSSALDTSKLAKKIGKKQQQQQQQQQEQEQMPEGKDGFDPHISQEFSDSVMKLGAQIQSHYVDPRLNQEFSALKQLRNRKSLYIRGEKENEDEMNGVSQSSRTMIHPRSLGGLLSDLKDPRVSEERILEDYKLHPDFLKELGTRFKLATTTLIIKEEAKEGEVLVQNSAPSNSGEVSVSGSPMTSTTAGANGKDGDESAQLKEIDPERLKQLRNRLGLDDETEIDEVQKK